MTLKIVKKLLMMIPIILLVSVMLFCLLQALPGDAAQVIAGEFGTEAEIEAYRKELGLDQPMYIQYFKWLTGMLQGNFGKSLMTGTPIVNKIAQRMPATIELALLSVLLSIVVALPLGIISAVYRNSPIDSAVSVLSVVGISMPSFWLGTLLIMLLSLKLQWLPASGYVPFTEDPITSLKLMIMPSIAVCGSVLATNMRQIRNSMLEVLDQDYILTAKAKGLPGHILIWKHAFRNALIPVVTVIAMQMGKLFGGACLAETIFCIPGIGNEIVVSLMNRDYPITMAMIMIVAIIIIFINTFIDVIYGFIDPRVGRGE